MRLIRRRRPSPDLLLVGIGVGVWRPAFDNWVEMAKRHGYASELIGRELAEPYLAHATRRHVMLQFLAEMRPEHLVCFVDTLDAFVCENVDVLLTRYRALDRPVVVEANGAVCIGAAGALTEAVRDGFELPTIAVDDAETLALTIAEHEPPASLSAPILHFPQNGIGYNAVAQRLGLAAAELDERGGFALRWPLDVPIEPVTSPYRAGEPERIPPIAHYVIDASAPTFDLVHYVAVRSCLELAGVEEVHLHCASLPAGEYWTLLAPHVQVHQIDPGPSSSLDLLAEHGGVYADVHIVFVDRLPGRFRRAQFVIARESDSQLSTAVLMSKPGAPFVEAWRRKRDPSGVVAYRLAAKIPDEVRVEAAGAFPIVHLGASEQQVDEEWIRTSDAPYARAARRFLPER